MKVSNSYKLFAITITLLLIIIVIVIFKALHIQNAITHSEQHRFRSFSLAVELFQSSEDLTRMARSYVSTGKSIYEKRYFEILDIRNGKQPRPANYNATYWHLAGVGRGPAVAQGETISLQKLMRREGFTEQEFNLLRKSQANSDHLVNMEKQAFAAMKGLYDDGHGNFTVRRASNRDYAVRLLYGDEYFDEKARIMAPIEQFMEALDKRTNAELISFQSQLRQYILLALAFIAITLFIVVIKIFHMFRSVLFPIERLRSKVSEIASGNFAARCDILSANEIGDLSTNFNSMANFIETEIITRKKAEEQLRESEERIRVITNSANNAIIMMDNNESISYWNPAAERILGYTGKEAIGKILHDLIIPERFIPKHIAALPEFYKTGQGNAIGKNLELAALRKDGQEIDIALSLSAVNINGQWNAIGIIQDITERKKAEEQIKHMATHDLLTDLPSLRLAKDRLSSALNIARRYKKAAAVMFIDLDGFKTVNDTLGHDAGDYVLKEVAQRMISCVRETDTVARVGGDEFLIIATEINAPENASQIAEKVIQLVSRPVIFNGQQAIVGASIGIALFPGDSEDMDQLIKQADEAMYRVKNAGKNGFRFVNSALI